FFASMKKEELYRANYHSYAEFKRRVDDYINFHNNERPHATLAYKTPNAHETLFYDGKKQK
ncbi:MAG: IS3 family transposase, partial [Oscillospiraceae bacterium]